MEQEILRSYLAGVWDADGCFGISKRCGRWESYQPFASIGLADPKAEIIFDLLKGNFNFKHLHTWHRERRNPNHKTVYRWGLYSQQACDFAKILEPYLIIKKERAQILMEWPKIENKLTFNARIPIHEKQTQLFERMKIFNRRGNPCNF